MRRGGTVLSCSLVCLAACFTGTTSKKVSTQVGKSQAAAEPPSLVGTIRFEDGTAPNQIGITFAPSVTDYIYPLALPAQISAAGEFSLGRITPGKYDVIIAGPGFSRIVLTAQAIRRMGTVNLGALTAKRGTVIAGIINDVAGNPIPGAWVRVFRRADPRDLEFVDTDELSRLARESYLSISDKDGGFRIDGVALPQGEFLQLSAVVNGVYASGLLQVTAPDKVQTIVAHPVGSLEGMVKGPWSAERYLILRRTTYSASLRTTQHIHLEPNGSFRADNLPEGDYELESVPERTVRKLHITAGSVTSLTP
jgi:hypothetical protein